MGHGPILLYNCVALWRLLRQRALITRICFHQSLDLSLKSLQRFADLVTEFLAHGSVTVLRSFQQDCGIVLKRAPVVIKMFEPIVDRSHQCCVP